MQLSSVIACRSRAEYLSLPFPSWLWELRSSVGSQKTLNASHLSLFLSLSLSLSLSLRFSKPDKAELASELRPRESGES